MGRPARDGEPERDGAGVGDHDVEARRLGDDAQVARDPGADRGERALATVLLRRDERDEQLALQPVERPGRPEGAHRAEDRGDAALHVEGAAAVEFSVAQEGVERVALVARRRHRVVVAVEHQ